MIAAIVRSFNNKNLSRQIEKLLGELDLDYAVVAINADTENGGEENNGEYSRQLLKKAFGRRFGDKLIVQPIKNWGKNPGSAAALNEAASVLFYRLGRLPNKKDVLFNVSVESGVNQQQIVQATVNGLWKNENLAVVGISRVVFMGETEEDRALADQFQKRFQRPGRLQYRVPQNTGAFWRADLLRLAGGFRTECDFSGQTISIDGKKVPAAGMEDFLTLCYLVMNGFNWSMIKKYPMIWDLSDIKKDPERWQLSINKFERQEKTMELWTKKFFGIDLREMRKILKSKEIAEM